MFPNQTIWAFNTPNEENLAFVYESVQKGRSRFGWGTEFNGDLRRLDPLPWAKLSQDEALCFRKTNFLLRINPKDWIVHINVPTYGRCVAVQATGSYEFDVETPTGDFRHYIPVDSTTKIEFD